MTDSDRHIQSTIGRDMLVKDVMTKGVISISKYESVMYVADILSEKSISGLPVVDKANKVVGIITQADILSMVGVGREHTFKDLLKYMLGEKLPERRMGDHVGDIMTAPAITIGPASSAPAVIARLIRAGMDAARINFSHGDRKDHISRIRMIRKEARKAGKQIAIIQDLQGPKLRVGDMKDDAAPLRRGDTVMLTSKKLMGTSSVISVTYPRLRKDLKSGDTVLFDDGRLELKVTGKSAAGLICTVVRGGVLKSHKGMNLPGAKLSLPSLSRKDRNDLILGIEQGVDYVALSFVRTAGDIESARRFLGMLGADTPIIAKIEKPEAIRNLDEIIAAADGVMVARGDLGVEMSPEQVPLLQKRIIRACNDAEKPVITATQMLESMIESPQPTRAEASDVANAILDGTDCVMLSGETAVGKHPVQAVEFMARIASEAEQSLAPLPPDHHISGPGESIAHAACRSAGA